MVRRKQVYKITYPNGKIYVGMDLTGSVLYFGSPSAARQIAEDLDLDDHRFDLTLRKEILWESVRDRDRRRGPGDGGAIDPRDRREQSCDRLQRSAPLRCNLTIGVSLLADTSRTCTLRISAGQRASPGVCGRKNRRGPRVQEPVPPVEQCGPVGAGRVTAGQRSGDEGPLPA